MSRLLSLTLRQQLFVAFTVLVLGVSTYEIVQELLAGEPVIDMLDDLAMFAISLVVIVLFVVEHVGQQRALATLERQLASVRGQLAALDGDSPRIARQYRDVIQKQFEVWRLTASEQDVVLGLLKGLSFREIGELREVREKTVRQQAANVYRKAGLGGRHELAAWFFEDLLDPSDVARQVDGI